MQSIRWSRLLALAGLATAVCGVNAGAQPPAGPPPGDWQGGGPRGPGGPGGPGGPRGMGRMGMRRERSAVMLPLSAMKSALGLSAKQVAQVQAIQNQFRKTMRAQFRNGDTAGGPPSREQMRSMMAVMQKANAGAEKRLQAVLTASQRAKLKQLVADGEMYRAVGIPIEAAQGLKITAAQRAKIAALAKNARPRFTPGAPPDPQQWMKQREATRAALNKILTHDQRAALQKYAQAHPRRGFEGMGPGGPGGPGGMGPGGPGGPGGFGPPGNRPRNGRARTSA